MTSLVTFKGSFLAKLQTLPERFFASQSRLEVIAATSSIDKTATERLPDGLFKGLARLRSIDIDNGGVLNLPNMDDLTVTVPHATADCFWH